MKKSYLVMTVLLAFSLFADTRLWAAIPGHLVLHLDYSDVAKNNPITRIGGFK